MKSTLSTIALAALVALAPLIQGHAQTTHDSSVNVPFGFNRVRITSPPGPTRSACTFTIAVFSA
jgi:hypothetical protein